MASVGLSSAWGFGWGGGAVQGVPSVFCAGDAGGWSFVKGWEGRGEWLTAQFILIGFLRCLHGIGGEGEAFEEGGCRVFSYGR